MAAGFGDNPGARGLDAGESELGTLAKGLVLVTCLCVCLFFFFFILCWKLELDLCFPSPGGFPGFPSFVSCRVHGSNFSAVNLLDVDMMGR